MMTEETTGALIMLCKRRSAMYGFLSCLFSTEVTEDLLDELIARRYPAATGSEKMNEGYRKMTRYLSNIWEDSCRDLAADFSRTFIGHGIDAHAAAYPQESVHTGEKRLTMGNARTEVLALYRSQGMRKETGWREDEDHVAVELDFMCIMAQRTAEALQAGDASDAESMLRVQGNFVADHFAWIPSLASQMRRFSKTDFYQGLSLVTEGFAMVDREFLDEINAENAA